jgi:hypothetical protein
MFDLKTMDPKEIFSIEYHFEDENLNLEIRDPIEIEIIESGYHIITDCGGIFVISPKWVYLSIIKKLKD